MTPQEVDTKEQAMKAASAPGGGMAVTGGVSGSNVNGGTGSAVRTAPAPRVNPDSISSSNVDPSNPKNAATFGDYEATKALTPEETKNISDRFMKDLQAQNDLITAEFAAKTTRQQTSNDAQAARTRVLNTKSGNIDSGTGAAALSTEEKKGKEALDSLDQEKNAKLSMVLGNIDKLQYDAIEKATSDKASDVKAYNDNLAANKKTAMDSVKTLAESGTSIDALKEDKAADGSSTYDKLVKASGMTPLEFDVAYNAQHDAAHQIKYEYKQVGDTLFAYGNDPKTGKVVVQSQHVPGLSDGKWTVKETKDGKLYQENTNGDIRWVTPPTTSTDPTQPESSFTMTPAQRNGFAKLGPQFDKSFLDKVQADIRKYGVQKVIDSQTDQTYKDAITKILNPAKGTQRTG